MNSSKKTFTVLAFVFLLTTISLLVFLWNIEDDNSGTPIQKNNNTNTLSPPIAHNNNTEQVPSNQNTPVSDSVIPVTSGNNTNILSPPIVQGNTEYLNDNSTTPAKNIGTKVTVENKSTTSYPQKNQTSPTNSSGTPSIGKNNNNKKTTSNTQNNSQRPPKIPFVSANNSGKTIKKKNNNNKHSPPIVQTDTEHLNNNSTTPVNSSVTTENKNKTPDSKKTLSPPANNSDTYSTNENNNNNQTTSNTQKDPKTSANNKYTPITNSTVSVDSSDTPVTNSTTPADNSDTPVRKPTTTSDDSVTTIISPTVSVVNSDTPITNSTTSANNKDTNVTIEKIDNNVTIPANNDKQKNDEAVANSNKKDENGDDKETELREKYCYGVGELNEIGRKLLFIENFPEFYQIEDSASKELKGKLDKLIKEKSKDGSHKTAKDLYEILCEEYKNKTSIDFKNLNKLSENDFFLSKIKSKEKTKYKRIKETKTIKNKPKYNFENIEANIINLKFDSKEIHKISGKIGKLSDNLDLEKLYKNGKRALLESYDDYIFFKALNNNEKSDFELEKTLDIGGDQYKLVWVNFRTSNDDSKNTVFIKTHKDGWVSIDDNLKVKQVDFKNLNGAYKNYKHGVVVFYKKVKKDN